MTSHDVVAYLRRLLGQRKAGHCGTLDPLATGVLAVCLGSATAFSEHLAGMPKAYRAEAAFGFETDTLDFAGAYSLAGGAPLSVRLRREAVAAALAGFLGTQEQTPPMHSAVKIGGKRLYEYAREGAQVERRTRTVMIYGIRLVRFDDARARALFDVRCSKGTYIRSLCRDLGAALGVPACMSFLLRTVSSGISIGAALPLEEVERLHASGGLIGRVVAVGDALAARYAAVDVAGAQARRFCDGGAIEVAGGVDAFADAGYAGGVDAFADAENADGAFSDAENAGGVDAFSDAEHAGSCSGARGAAGAADGVSEPVLLRVYCGARFIGLGCLASAPLGRLASAPLGRASHGGAGGPGRPAPPIGYSALQPVRVFHGHDMP